MALPILFLCIFVFGQIGFSVGEEEVTEYSVNLNREERWFREIEKFNSSLQIINDKGELVNLTLVPEAPRDARIGADDILFMLYTKKNPTEGQRLKTNTESIKNSNFDASKRTVFITHGFMNKHTSEACVVVRDAYLKNNDLNVIVVDWWAIAGNPFYPFPANDVPAVGKKVAQMIKFLADNAYLKLQEVVLSGHSLGAHVMGIAGYHTGGKVKAVYGLDPAQLMFNFAGPGFRISRRDAAHVQIIHTNAGWLGIGRVLGHIDFFVNGGLHQAGCWTAIGPCSHSRAYMYFAESINSSHGFWGRHCSKLSHLLVLEDCFGDKKRRMGGLDPDMDNITSDEIYAVTTNDQSPFAKANV